MFDDPKKELRELEDRLLAAQPKEDSLAQFDDVSLDEYIPAESGAEPDIRNFANGYGRAVPRAPIQPFYGYDTAPSHADRSIRGLTILASVECAAIAAVALYWFFHFL